MKYYRWFISIFQKFFFQNLPRGANKIKVSVKKLSKLFGSCNDVTECVSKAIGEKLWRSAWLLIAKRKHNWFIERAFWKQRQNTQSVNLLQQSDIIDEVTEEPWLRNEMYILKKEDQHLLLSKDAWLNDGIMDPAQKLIGNKLVQMGHISRYLILKRKPLILSILYLKSMFSSFMMELIIGFSTFAQMGVYKSVTVFVQV